MSISTPPPSAPPRSPRRRRLLCGVAAATLGGALASAGNANAAGTDPRKLPAQNGDILVFPSWEHDGRVLELNDVQVGAAPLLVYPQDPVSGVTRERSRLNQILVLRFEPADLDEKHAQLAADGVLAYSGLCTHTACGVSEWNAEQRHLQCPCHGSEFDPLRAGARVSGPAPRALPALPLALSGTHLLIAGAFTARVGANA